MRLLVQKPFWASGEVFKIASCFAPQTYLHSIRILRVNRWSLFLFKHLLTVLVQKYVQCAQSPVHLVMRPSSLGGGRILRRNLSVCLSVRPVSGCTLFTVAPSYERTCKIEKLRFSLMGHRHVCTFRHAQRAAYRTAISAAQILVKSVAPSGSSWLSMNFYSRNY